jgi:hypothetical protein
MAANNPGGGATNRLGVRYVAKGPPGLRAKLNEMIRCFDYLFPSPSADIVAEVTPQGTLFRFRVPQSTTTRARTITKWTPVVISGEAKITIADTADVEGIIPTIDVSGTPTLVTATPAPQLTIVTGDVYFECTMDAAGTFTAVAIKSAASMPSNTSTLRYRRLYTVTVTGTSPNAAVVVTSQPVTTAVSHKLCGGLSTWGQA